jgi:two-component system CheB/CheR fusion protein
MPVHPSAVPLRILVVDDLRDAADSMAMLLSLVGHQTLTAYDGPAAVRAAGEFRPQAVLLDLSLPGMTGYDVLAQLRRVPGCERALVIAVSGYGRQEDRERTLAAGFDAHFLKPVEVERLLVLLAAATRLEAAD